MTGPVVIAGSGAAGLATADALRTEGYDGAILLLGDEPHAPYDRPPLSKQVLTGAWRPDRAVLRSRAELAARGIDFRPGTAAVALDPAASTLTLSNGTTIGYAALVAATGVAPRRLPGTPAQHVLRGLDDTLRLRGALTRARRVAVVGAGFLGCEITAAARTMGIAVTLADPFPTPLHAPLGPLLGTMIAGLHRDRGVDLRLGHAVAALETVSGNVAGIPATPVPAAPHTTPPGVAASPNTDIRAANANNRAATAGDHPTNAGDRIAAVLLDDGTRIPADLVVTAIGCVPRVGWLRDSGVPLADGVVCDAHGRAAERVWAAGDVAAWWSPALGRHVRVEHRFTAGQHGRIVARDILGLPHDAAPDQVPYFWSDQYDLKIQAYGLPSGADEVRIVEGSLDERRFVAVYLSGDEVTAVAGAGMARAMRQWRQAVVDRRLPAAT
ncbi:NAD(P)/FAD-dependent oxidoreductase [Catenuloplanes indicus]|uniref:NADPH-dependent 2,4-dienoyl-CoA reductase/sulfur reductase-like enzyme n=1 Tax=Catenuloplanes indicus TaxID=137267 RepID=A0AAE3WA43_9ACTN|nr:FAD/NAD(P)-binding oxidoreductase [Catenuloplanes indicus]MDQ0371399.1 NADPH-dependent 2,4-dienoyl-CoA reductase/sulfur reductase-like enzyme [Catenuloplanes indicus]